MSNYLKMIGDKCSMDSEYWTWETGIHLTKGMHWCGHGGFEASPLCLLLLERENVFFITCSEMSMEGCVTSECE